MPNNNQNSPGKNRNNTQTPQKTGQSKNGTASREEFSRELTEIINKNTQTGQNKTPQKRKNNK